MEVQRIRGIIRKGEGPTVEFKKANRELPKNLFDTICAFLNRNGGNILLGVDDNGDVKGISEKNAEIMSQNLINLSNNPHIAKFFVQLSRAEDLGTGIRNTYHYSKLYSGEQPKFLEEDTFKVIIPLKNTAQKTTQKKTEHNLVKVIEYLSIEPQLSMTDLAQKIKVSKQAIRYYIDLLKKRKIIVRKGPLKGGKWVIKKNNSIKN